MEIRKGIFKGLLVITIIGSLTLSTVLAEENTLKESNPIEIDCFENEEPITIELNASEIIGELDKYGIDENSTDKEIDIVIESILSKKPGLFASASHGGGSLPSKPSIGTSKNVVIKIPNNDILAIAGSATISKSIITRAFKSLTSYFVPLGKLSNLAISVASVNSGTGYKGFQYTVTMTYKKTTIFDGQHVTYTGWHVTGYSGFKRYK